MDFAAGVRRKNRCIMKKAIITTYAMIRNTRLRTEIKLNVLRSSRFGTYGLFTLHLSLNF